MPQLRALPGRVTANSAEAYIACCLAGLGLIQIPAYDVAEHLAAGELVEGSESAVKRIVDRWTWLRDVRSGDPNWKLVDTDYGD